MGRAKSLIEIGGVAMGRIVADVLGAASCDPVAFISCLGQFVDQMRRFQVPLEKTAIRKLLESVESFRR